MNVTKNNNEKELELAVELSAAEMKPYIDQACRKISQETKVEGFRPGHAPYDVLKQKVSEIYILEEAANIAIQKTAAGIIKDNLQTEDVIGRPEVRLTKLAAGNPLEFKIVLSLAPVVTLGKYKELKIKQTEAPVKDEAVEKVLRDLRAMRAKEVVAEREIRDKDKAVVNIQMFLDNVPIEGGQSHDTAVIIGADYIIPGFDKQLLGAKKGDVREFKLPYPDNHYQKNLAGKMAEFKVSVQAVYERDVPELTDEFAKNLGGKDAADLKNKIKENLTAEARQKSEQKAVVEIFEKILAGTTFSHLSEQVVHNETHSMLREMKANVEAQGGKFSDYLMHLKKTEEQLEEELKPEAEKRVKTSFVVSQIVKEEGIAVTDEELRSKIDETLKIYDKNSEMRKQAETPEYRHYVKSSLLNQKVVDKLKEWNLGNIN